MSQSNFFTSYFNDTTNTSSNHEIKKKTSRIINGNPLIRKDSKYINNKNLT